MKDRSILFLLAALILFDATPTASQTQWTKYSGNPVLDAGSVTGSWDFYGAGAPRIVRVGDTLKMWYSGKTTLTGGGVYSIGYAWSTDGGTSWTKYANNPVFTAQLAWEGGLIFLADVVYAGSQYKMWYTAAPHQYHHVGYATSPDGIHWTRRANPVLDPGPSAWDNQTVSWPSVLGPDNSGRYKMWYQGYPASVVMQIGYATASNETTWAKYGSGPVLQLGSSGTWEDRHLEGPTVIYNGQFYEMWYNGEQTNLFADSRIGYATSPDGVIWTKYPSNPVLQPGPTGSWDNVSVFTGEVMLDGSMYRMWYSGYDGSRFRIGYATAPVVIPAVEDLHAETAGGFTLHQNYPNPFNPSTEIQFSLSQRSYVTLTIFDLLGREVAKLVSTELSAGSYSTRWDAAGMASGVYVYTLRARHTNGGQAGEFAETKKLLLLH